MKRNLRLVKPRLNRAEHDRYYGAIPSLPDEILANCSPDFGEEVERRHRGDAAESTKHEILEEFEPGRTCHLVGRCITRATPLVQQHRHVLHVNGHEKLVRIEKAQTLRVACATW